MTRTVSRGMICVGGATYRIERTEPHCYSVVRLLDDVEVGTFRTLPQLRVHPVKVDVNLLRDIVRAAMRSARTSAVMHIAPAFAPDEEERRVTVVSVPSAPPAAAASLSDAPPAAAASVSSTPPVARQASSAPPVMRSPSSAPPPAGMSA